MNLYPDNLTALSLWKESLDGIIKRKSLMTREYVFHTIGIGEAAAKIAAYSGLNTDKAYACGLLHDWGKIQKEKETGIAHFIVGYQKMVQEGFSDIARICLTHSFPDCHFKRDDYPAYSDEDILFVKDYLKNIVYDDYDRLIQLCDMFFEGLSKVSYQKRLEYIRARYRLEKSQTAVLEKCAAENKAYFDKKCGQDIYKLLGIEG